MMKERKYHGTPRVSPDERYLIQRSKRLTDEMPPLLVRLHQAPDMSLQMPLEHTLASIRNRMSMPVGDLDTVPTLVLSEEDVEESGFDVWTAAKR
jgi:hypothetical protein